MASQDRGAPGPEPGSEDALIHQAADELRRTLDEEPPRWLLVDVGRQRLLLIEAGAAHRQWPVSTGAAGVDAREGSGGTPPGLHAVRRKIGGGSPPGTVFRSRRATGERWVPGAGLVSEGAGGPGQQDEDLVLTRILTLEGLQDGVNKGPGVDSLARCVYIHGTNDEDRIGRPVSHGCIRLRSADVIDLYERVEEGDPVVIV